MNENLSSPFDDFPENGTPEQFWKQTLLALNWLAPYLNDNDEKHTYLVMTCRAYASMLYPAPENYDAPEDWPLLVMRQRQIVTVFTQIRAAIIAAQAVTQVKSQSKSQRERASKPRKLDEDQSRRIAKAYWEMNDGRAIYGSVKALATRFDVSETTIRSVAKKYKPN